LPVAGLEDVLGTQLLGAVALKRLELAEHEAIVRRSSEVVKAVGGVACGRRSANPQIRQTAENFAHSASRLNQHRRDQSKLGLCTGPARVGKKERDIKLKKQQASTVAALQQRQRELEEHQLRQRLQELEAQKAEQELERAAVEWDRAQLYDPTKPPPKNPAFGRAPRDPEVPEGLPAVNLGSQATTAQEEDKAWKAFQAQRQARLANRVQGAKAAEPGGAPPKRGRGGTGARGLPPAGAVAPSEEPNK
jgi:hypothetical protein